MSTALKGVSLPPSIEPVETGRGVGANVDEWKKIEDDFFGGKCTDLFWDLSRKLLERSGGWLLLGQGAFGAVFFGSKRPKLLFKSR